MGLKQSTSPEDIKKVHETDSAERGAARVTIQVIRLFRVSHLAYTCLGIKMTKL
jgi:hypothetical protein